MEESIITQDRTKLWMWRRPAPQAVAEAILVHGFGEHSGRYGALTSHLSARGCSVTGYDQRGHGKSDGARGHVERFKDYEDDLGLMIRRVVSNEAPLPLFLVAHSMGGLIALRYLLRNDPAIRGAVISAPLVGVAARVPPHKLLIGKISAALMPRLTLNNEIDPAVLSRDPNVGAAYAADPLVHHVVSARWFAEATRAMEDLTRRASEIKKPLLILHGSDDKLASYDATARLFPLIGSKDKELRTYSGFYHELFNEPEKEELFSTVTNWISGHLAA
ncbi:MAG: alpha/beta hydrolase [Blastocatellia bacterium AA13]|nr:MAG: alpha/beta hydrolase [Blastocatellia bacterium AA13]